MDELLRHLMMLALSKHASDIHFVVQKNRCQIQLRTSSQMELLYQDLWTPAFFEYLKFISGFDLTNPYMPQSGQFEFDHDGQMIFCRFSVIINGDLQTGVLRILNTHVSMSIDDLSQDKNHIDFLKRFTHMRQGLVLSSGPTNSGKTTTLHAVLHSIAMQSRFKVVSLEDPIEIEDDLYLQLQINEEQGFTYEKGIEELLRHDPDVILIGETRNEYTAHMVIRAALSGHLVFSTVHAKNGLETLGRFLDFGVSKYDLQVVCSAIIAQRLYASAIPGKKVCIYEMVDKKEIEYILKNGTYSKEHRGLDLEIQRAVDKGTIMDKQALFDIQSFQG